MGFEEIQKAKIELHEQRVKEKITDDYEELSFEMFVNALESVSRKPGKKYSFITKAGRSLKEAIIFLFSEVWRTEKIPEGWKKSTLVQLYKGKGHKLI